MGETSSLIGLVVILILYVSVGGFAVVGSAVLTKKFLRPWHEQVFYGGFLLAIALFYVAFIAYFADPRAWMVESIAIVVFAALAVAGFKFPWALIVGYPLHGLWDLAHELAAHSSETFSNEAGALTQIPLAYGAFCASFDIGIAVYFLIRKREWNLDRQQPAPAASPTAQPG